MQPIDSDKFQRVFKEMDDAAMLGYPEVAAVMRITPDFASSIKAALPKPAIDQPRFVRWTAGQIRAWLTRKAAGAEESTEPVKRHGRPRKSVTEGGAA